MRTDSKINYLNSLKMNEMNKIDLKITPFTFGNVFKSHFSFWKILIFIIFAFMIFDTTIGFDTKLNNYTHISFRVIKLLPQEILIIFALITIVVKPSNLNILFKTKIGNLILVFFLMVSVWTVIRIGNADASKVLIRTYYGSIVVIIALCILLENIKSIYAALYMIIVSGFIGGVIMWLISIIGIDKLNFAFNNITQREEAIGSNHYGLFGQSMAFVQISIFYVTANVIFYKKLGKRNIYLIILILLIGLDVVNMGRTQLIFNFIYLIFGLFYIAPKLGKHLKSNLKILIGLIFVFLLIYSLLINTFDISNFLFTFKERFENGLNEIKTGSGSFEKHHLEQFYRLKLMKEDGLGTLIYGAGPDKVGDYTYLYKDDDKIIIFNNNPIRSVSSDSFMATLLGWYGIFGFILMILIGLFSIKIFVKSNLLDIRLKYILSIAAR